MKTEQTTCPVMPRQYVEISSYRECDEVLRRSQIFAAGGAKPESAHILGGTVISLDGAEHLARRRLFAKMLDLDQPWGPRGSLLLDNFDRNLQQVRAGEDDDVRFDLIGFSRRVLWQTFAEMIGLDGVAEPGAVERLQTLVPAMLAGVAVEYSTRDHDVVVAESVQALAEFRERFFAGSYERRRPAVVEALAAGGVQDLPGDVITRMIVAGHGSPNVDLVLRESVVFFAGSVDNPVSQAANTIEELDRWLVAHPEDTGRLHDDRFLHDVVIETFRLRRTGVAFLVRHALEEATLQSDRVIPAGSWLALYLGRANLDPEIFGPDAAEFNPHRVVAQPGVKRYGLAFGAGPHVCIGRPVMTTEHGDPPLLGIQARLLKCLVDAGVRPDPAGARVKNTTDAGRDQYVEFGVRIDNPVAVATA